MKILSPNEALTRARQIDPQLRRAGWNLNDRTQVRLEVPVDGYDAEPWNGAMCHGQDIKSIQCKNDIQPSFATFVLKFYERRLLDLARGANTEG